MMHSIPFGNEPIEAHRPILVELREMPFRGRRRLFRQRCYLLRFENEFPLIVMSDVPDKQCLPLRGCFHESLILSRTECR